MSGIPGLLIGAALRFPRTASAIGATGGFIKSHWKWFVAAGAAVGLYFAATAYLQHRDDANYEKGFATAESQAADLVRDANERAAKDQAALDLITQRFGFLAKEREAAVTTIVQPQIERITREVRDNPVYGACAVTDGVFDATNAAVAGVNASIGARASDAAR